jgi:16S rRNA G966 N2-methylase RsmD
MVRIERTDALAWMSRCAPGRFELVLLDPPFDADLAVPAAVVAAPLACAGGFVYLESGQPLAEPPPGLVPYRHLKAGAVHAQLFQRQG